MFIELLIIFALFLFGFLVIIYILNRRLNQLQNKQADSALLEWLKTMQSSLDSTNKHINETLNTSSTHMMRVLQENAKQLHDRLDKAAEAMRDVNREVGKMSEIGRNMQELQDFLKSPKLRGNIGEQVLKDLIAQSFPKNTFSLQYQFKSGEKVDAAIKTDAGILPIDAKFPMENFQKMLKSETQEMKDSFQKEFIRDVKKHIVAIARKYVLPDEGTMDFALMYIPSETVFYEIINLHELIEYAKNERVYVVSPSTLYAHLQTILLSFEGKKIEQRSKEVFSLIRAIKIDYEKVNDSLDILGKHITNASGQYHNVSKGFLSLGQKLEATKHLKEIEEDPVTLASEKNRVI